MSRSGPPAAPDRFSAGRITRRSFTAVGLAPLVCRASPAAPAVFPFGTHVYREPHLPLEQLRADFPLLKRLGFNMVKLQESWSADEPKEGEIDLSTVESVVSGARRHGLLVYFGVTMEQAPAWLWKKYPDASMVYETGEPHNSPTQYLMPADGKPGPCWNHPGARAAAIRFIETVGRTIGRFDNIVVWNVWQEIGFRPLREGRLGLCYCPHTLQAFREWLRGTYGTLDRLNARWRTHYGAWDEADPPRLYTQVPSWIDWRRYMDEIYLAGAIRWKAEAFRRSDPRRRPILAHMSRPTIGSTAEWRFSEVLDLFGSSAYPSWGELPDPALNSAARVRKSPAVYRQLWDRVLLSFDYVRSASRNGAFWTAELQGGRAGGGVDPGRVPDRGDIRRWTLGCLAAGARGICFWNHRTEPFWGEAHGFGLLQMTGERTERAEEASRIARAVARHPDLFAKGEHPPAPVAILLDSHLWHFIGGSGRDVISRYDTAIRGLYKALWEEGVPAEFLEADAIPRRGSSYKALLFPYPIAVAPRTVDALSDYVRGGGTLIAEACAGRYNDETFGVPGEMAPGFVTLFGAEHKELNVLAPNASHVLSGAGDFAGHQVAATAYLQFLALRGARPVLVYRDEVAACVNRFGKGTAYLAGTLLGRPIVDRENSPNQRFVAAMLARAGVPPDRIGKLQRRRRILGNKQAWFLFNCTRETIEQTVSVEGFRSVSDLLDIELPVSGGQARVAVEPMDIRCLVLEG